MKYRESDLTEREFVTEYLLNRAMGHSGGLGVESVIKSGRCAWLILQAIPGPQKEAK